MKFYIKVFSFLTIATLLFILGWKFFDSFGKIIGDDFSKRPLIELKGTNWTSEFYHYRNNYFFQTDSTGYSEDGQYCWSTPIDTALYHNSKDSIAYDRSSPFKYTLNDSSLIIKYKPLHDEDSVYAYRIRKDKYEISFVSKFEYTYGHEVLYKKKK